jgi:hypothetical protein
MPTTSTANTDVWERLSDGLRVSLARDAMREAAESIARQAEAIAGAIDEGDLPDHGGPNALRLFAESIRSMGAHLYGPEGRA